MEQREDNKNDIASRRLKNLFGEALGDLSSVEEAETAWQAFASRRRQERVRTLVFGFAAVASVTLLLFWGFSQENFLSQEVEVFASVNSPDKLVMTEDKGIIAVRTPPATTITIQPGVYKRVYWARYLMLIPMDVVRLLKLCCMKVRCKSVIKPIRKPVR